MHVRVLVALAATVAVGVVGWAVLARGEEKPSYVAEHAVEAPQAARTVNVSRTMPMPSAHARNLSAMLERGAMPHRPMRGEVLTDTDCTPDEQMISRCRNEVMLDDGGVIILRHPHDMTKVPCLAPGEHVRLVPTGV